MVESLLSRPVGIDLFAGAGGLSLGFEQAGFHVAAAVDVDPVHCAVHAYNFPHTQVVCASVVDLTGAALRLAAGLGDRDIDVVFGGAPCQGFSMIGKRALDDPRNQLVSHYVRLVKELSPKYCVFENVKGLTQGGHVQFLNELIETLNDGGYHVVLPYRVLNAAHFGVPQSRERLFLLAARQGQPMPVYPVPTTPVPHHVTVADALNDLPDAETFPALLLSDETLATWTTSSAYAQRLRGLVNDPDDYSPLRPVRLDRLTCSGITEHSDASRRRFAATLPGKVEPISRFLRLRLDGLCNTLRAGTDSARGAHTSPRPIHPVHARVLTVREAARLHSYPDWFRLHATKWHGFRQVGNSVPPLLGRAVATSIRTALGVVPTRPTHVFPLGNEGLLRMNLEEAARHFSVPRTVIAQRQRKPVPSDT